MFNGVGVKIGRHSMILMNVSTVRTAVRFGFKGLKKQACSNKESQADLCTSSALQMS